MWGAAEDAGKALILGKDCGQYLHRTMELLFKLLSGVKKRSTELPNLEVKFRLTVDPGSNVHLT